MRYMMLYFEIDVTAWTVPGTIQNPRRKGRVSIGMQVEDSFAMTSRDMYYHSKTTHKMDVMEARRTDLSAWSIQTNRHERYRSSHG